MTDAKNINDFQSKNCIKSFVFSGTLLIGIFFSQISFASDDPCLDKASGGKEILECNAKKIELSNQNLEYLVSKVKKSVSELDIAGRDTKDVSKQLDKIQKAWKQSAGESCDFAGEQKGGGYLWGTIFAQQCLINEIQSRIKFFDEILNSPH